MKNTKLSFESWKRSKWQEKDKLRKTFRLIENEWKIESNRKGGSHTSWPLISKLMRKIVARAPLATENILPILKHVPMTLLHAEISRTEPAESASYYAFRSQPFRNSGWSSFSWLSRDVVQGYDFKERNMAGATRQRSPRFIKRPGKCRCLIRSFDIPTAMDSSVAFFQLTNLLRKD